MNRRVFGLAMGQWMLPRWRGAAMGADVRVDGFDDRLPKRVRWRLGTLRLWHSAAGWPYSVDWLAVSPDGRLVATAGSELPVVLWDLATGREVRRLGGKKRPPRNGGFKTVTLNGLAFTPDGSVLAAGGPNGRVDRWEVATGRALAPFEQGHRTTVMNLAFSAEGNVLVTGDRDGFVLVRDPRTGDVRHRLGPHADHVAVLAVSKDGRTVISAGWNRSNTVSAWDAATGRLARELEIDRFDIFDNESVALAPDGELVALGREGYRIGVWNVRTGRIVADLEEAQDTDIQEGDPQKGHDEVAGLAFSPDGKTLASAGRDASVRLWDTATWAERQRLDWREGEAQAIAFTPDGASLLAGGSAGTVRVWSLPEGRERFRTTGHRSCVSQLAWSPDGRSVVSVGNDDAVCVTDAATGTQVRRNVLLPRICYAHDLAIDGRLLAYQGLLSDRRVSVVDTSTGRVVLAVDLRDQPGGVLLPRLSADGRSLYILDAERDAERQRVRVHDLATGNETHRVEIRAYADDVTVSPDGRFLATRWVNEVEVYDVAPGRLLHRLEHSPGPSSHQVDDFAFSPDGSTLATAGKDGRIRLWEPSSGRPLRNLDGHPSGVWRLAFPPDGKTLAGASFHDPVVRLYDVATGRETDRLTGHRGGVTCLAYSPDGRRLATGSDDTTVMAWDL